MTLHRYRTQLLIAAAAAAVSVLSLSMGARQAHWALAWLVPGVIAGILVRWGSRQWPAVALGILVASGVLHLSLSIVFASVVSSLGGPWALARYLEWAKFDRRLQQRADVIRFSLATAPAAALSAALLTVGLDLTAPGALPEYGSRCLAAWFSTMLGMTLLVPTICCASRDKLSLWMEHGKTAVLLVLAVMVFLVAATLVPMTVRGALLVPLGVVVVVISAMKLGMTFTGLLATCMTIGVAFITTSGGNLAAVAAESARAWGFGTVLSVLSLTVRALLAEREAADGRLRAAEVAYRKGLLEAARLEQRRIGREMHDALGQELTAVSLLARHLAKSLRNRPEASTEAQVIADAADRAQQSAREIARGELSGIRDGSQLCNALQALRERTAGALGITVSADLDATVPLSATAAQSVYRIAQESVNNAMRHSRAGSLRMSLQRCAGGVEFVVQDDGIGFPSPCDRDRSGLGLRTMQYRCELAGGRLDIRSTPGAGTVVRCVLPATTETATALAESVPVGDHARMIETHMRA